MEDDFRPPAADLSGRLGRVEALAETTIRRVADMEVQTRADMHIINGKLDILVDRDSRRSATHELLAVAWRTVGIPVMTALIAAIGFFARPILEFIGRTPPH